MGKFQKVGAWLLKRRGRTAKAHSLLWYIGQGLTSGIVIPACAIGAFYGVNLAQEAGLIDGFALFSVAPSQAEAPRSDYISALLDSGECWSGGEAPAEPTRVIYDGKVYDGDMVGKALDAIFADADNGVDPARVSGFCK